MTQWAFTQGHWAASSLPTPSPVDEMVFSQPSASMLRSNAFKLGPAFSFSESSHVSCWHLCGVHSTHCPMPLPQRPSVQWEGYELRNQSSVSLGPDPYLRAVGTQASDLALFAPRLCSASRGGFTAPNTMLRLVVATIPKGKLVDIPLLRTFLFVIFLDSVEISN